MNTLFSFFMAFLASFSTMIGYFTIYIKNDKKTVLFISLFISSLFILFISLFDLLKEGIKLINNNNKNIFIIILFILLGFIITYLINNLINKNDSLYRVGVLSIISIILHNIPEGMITCISSKISIDLQLKLILAITLHNIPEGITISIPIYYSTNSKKKAFIYSFISGFSELIGYLLCMFIFKNIDINLLGYILLIVVGVMIYLSIHLFLESLKYKKEKGSSLLF